MTPILFNIQILPQRKDLKLVVMSATLNCEQFQGYFNNAPVIKVPGRVYDVDVIYAKQPAPDYLVAAMDTVLHV